MDLALNNLQRLICHETQTTKQPTKLETNIFIQMTWSGVKWPEKVDTAKTNQPTNRHGQGMAEVQFLSAIQLVFLL